MIDVEPMLDAYAHGVPVDYIVTIDVDALRNEAELDYIMSSDFIGNLDDNRFPHMSQPDIMRR